MDVWGDYRCWDHYLSLSADDDDDDDVDLVGS